MLCGTRAIPQHQIFEQSERVVVVTLENTLPTCQHLTEAKQQQNLILERVNYPWVIDFLINLKKVKYFLKIGEQVIIH